MLITRSNTSICFGCIVYLVLPDSIAKHYCRPGALLQSAVLLSANAQNMLRMNVFSSCAPLVLVFLSTLSMAVSFTCNTSESPFDSSVASRITEARKYLRQVGRFHPGNDAAWEKDISQLHDLLHHQIKYHHSTVREHVFNLPANQDGTKNGLEKYKHEYPFGPTYARPISVGENIDLKELLQIYANAQYEWISSLQVMVTLFLLSSCVPVMLFTQTVTGGEDALNLLLRLGLVYVSDDSIGVDGKVIVPLVHLFPLQIPQLPDARDQLSAAKDIILMTDLHPNVLSATTISLGSEYSEEGAVMYIGPDSMALIQHLHASFLEYVNNCNNDSSTFRILDLCCGSGVQAIAILGMIDLLRIAGHEVAANVEALAIDVNERALRFTEFNAQLNRMNISTKKINLLDDNDTASNLMTCRGFDILLANPPFIPTPSMVSDDAALSIREGCSIALKSQSYGLFSSGGKSGEDCLRAIIQMAPSVLKGGGLLGVVSEFMNPPLQSVGKQKFSLLTKLEQWLGHDVEAKGILFTNEYPLTSQVYAQRRALADDNGAISLWLGHLKDYDIKHVSPGLLFVKFSERENGIVANKVCSIKCQLVPRTSLGSVWSPHNFHAVEFTMKILRDVYQISST